MMGFRTPLFAAMLFGALRGDDEDQSGTAPASPTDDVDPLDPVIVGEMPTPADPEQAGAHSFRVGGRLARRLGSRRR